MLFLLFELGKERYALDAREVVEILPLVRVNAIPRSPAGVAGVVNYRNQPVPIVDLSELVLGRPSLRRLATRLVVVRCPDGRGRPRLLGLIAEHATDTMRRDPSDFMATGIANDRVEYLGPVATDSRGVIQWIDATRLLTPPVRDALFTEGILA